MALGEIGLLLDYFYSLTPRQFANIVTGSRNRQMAESRERMEIMRNIMYASLLPYQKKGNSFTPQKLLKFDWEQEQKSQLSGGEVSEETLNAMLDKWEAIDALRKTKADC